MAVVVVQQIFPDYILSGSAATCALLQLYLYLQNKQISIDYLTPTRREFLKMLDLKLQKHKEESFTILVLSLKNFKSINKNFGQQSGDLFLQEISRYLQTAAAPNLLYRFGGDEFAVLVDRSRLGQVRDLVFGPLDRMTRAWNIGNYSCVIPGVTGIVHYPESANTREGLISSIEYSVAQAKRDRTKNYSYCTPEMLSAISRRNEVAEILKTALRTGDFQAYYQPLLSLETGRFTLAESLLRINNTPLGPIYPSEFIPIAEETGLIVGDHLSGLGTGLRLSPPPDGRRPRPGGDQRKLFLHPVFPAGCEKAGPRNYRSVRRPLFKDQEPDARKKTAAKAAVFLYSFILHCYSA